MPRVLIVDDDHAMRRVLFEVLSEKYECNTASTAEEALQFLQVESYDVIVTDLAMPGLDGMSLMKRVQLRDEDTPVIMISGRGSELLADQVMALGAFAYLSKPFDLNELEQTLDRALANT